MILRRQLMKDKKKKGFTLIELIVVIVIIAIIAAIAVPALARYIDTANNRAAQAQAHNIQVVLQAEVTEFYYDLLSDDVTGTTGGTDASYLFKDETPSNAPDNYPTDPTIENILRYNGVILGSGASIANIKFDNRRLAEFDYTHTNDVTVTFRDGDFDFD